MTAAAPRRWEPDEDEHLREHYGKVLREQLADDLGRSKSSIANRAAALGLTRKQRGAKLSVRKIKMLHAAGVSTSEIARRYRTQRHVVNRILDDLGVDRPKRGTSGGAPSAGADRCRGDIDRVVELYEAGVSACEIASAYGTTATTVLAALRGVDVEIRGFGGNNRPPELAAEAIVALAKHDMLDHASKALRRTHAWRAYSEAVVRESRSVDAGLGIERLPSQPLALAIQQWAFKQDTSWSEFVGGETRAAWAKPGGTVRASTADAWLIRMGLLWFDVWPDDPAARRYFEGC